ncbi:MAG: TlpA family protein disulfide reductase [Clostridia bacterium]|nr:TlpA family protein disulfide reductase [Clostridia bacterium]
MNAKVKYIILAAAAVILVAGAAVAYNSLSKKTDADSRLTKADITQTVSESASEEYSPSEITSASETEETSVSLTQAVSEITSAIISTVTTPEAETSTTAKPTTTKPTTTKPTTTAAANETVSETTAEPNTFTRPPLTQKTDYYTEPSSRVETTTAAPTVTSTTAVTSTAAPPSVTPSPDLTVYDSAGRKVRLSELRGKPVVLNMWTTWCPYCLREMPHFEKLAKEYDGKIQFMMVDLVGSNGETQKAAADYIAKQGYTFPVYYDNDYSVRNTYPVSGIPHTLFFDSNGNLYKRQSGAMDEATLRAYLEELSAL